MSEIVEKKTIFISGPSDVYDEINIIKQTIESLNKVFCPPFKIVMEVATGETHAKAGPGRPQSKINPWVYKCDLFIGVFGRTYGTSTGIYKSGSEEEFRIAFKRNQDSRHIFNLNSKYNQYLINGPIQDDLKQILDQNSIQLLPNAIVIKIDEINYEISDFTKTFIIEKKGKKLNVYKSEGNPGIILFFHNLQKDKLKNIGPQLESLLKFREDIRNYILYKSYSDKIELAFQSYEQIIQWIYSIIDMYKIPNMVLKNEV